MLPTNENQNLHVAWVRGHYGLESGRELNNSGYHRVIEVTYWYEAQYFELWCSCPYVSISCLYSCCCQRLPWESSSILCVLRIECTACLLVRLGVNSQVKVWGFMRCWTGTCAQDWSLSTFLSILSFACLMLGLSVSENPEKDCWQLSYWQCSHWWVGNAFFCWNCIPCSWEEMGRFRLLDGCSKYNQKVFMGLSTSEIY